jgi:hypothetical protein
MFPVPLDLVSWRIRVSLGHQYPLICSQRRVQIHVIGTVDRLRQPEFTVRGHCSKATCTEYTRSTFCSRCDVFLRIKDSGGNSETIYNHPVKNILCEDKSVIYHDIFENLRPKS